MKVQCRNRYKLTFLPLQTQDILSSLPAPPWSTISPCFWSSCWFSKTKVVILQYLGEVAFICGQLYQRYHTTPHIHMHVTIINVTVTIWSRQSEKIPRQPNVTLLPRGKIPRQLRDNWSGADVAPDPVQLGRRHHGRIHATYIVYT